MSIEGFLNEKLTQRVQPIPKILNILVILLAITTPSSRAAACLVASAISLLLLKDSKKAGRRRVIAKTLGAGILTFGAVVLFEFLRGIPFGKMEPITAINLVLVGVAICLFDAKTSKQHLVSHLVAFPIALIAFLPLIGYLYGSRFLIGIGPASEMPTRTAFCFLFLSISFFLTNLDDDLAAVLLSDGPGGYLSRRLLPAAILIPLALGWIRILAENAGITSASLGTAIFTTATIAGFVVLIWYQCIVLQHIERSRSQSERDREFLKAQAEVRVQFVSMLSHDLRNPISAANACAQMIRKNPENSAVLSDRIISVLNRADRLIQDLLDVNRIRSGHAITITRKDCELSSILRDTLEEMSLVHGNRFVLDSPTPIQGRWDCALLRRAVENLLGNALKYGSREAPIQVFAGRVESQVRISVQNEGKPIPVEEQKKLFQVFERASDAQQQGQQGWGIGLTLVRGIAEAHGGQVLLESTQEHGTTFTIEIPA